MLAAMAFHPVFLLILLFLVPILVAATLVLGWSARKGWEAADPATRARPPASSEQ